MQCPLCLLSFGSRGVDVTRSSNCVYSTRLIEQSRASGRLSCLVAPAAKTPDTCHGNRAPWQVKVARTGPDSRHFRRTVRTPVRCTTFVRMRRTSISEGSRYSCPSDFKRYQAQNFAENRQSFCHRMTGSTLVPCSFTASRLAGESRSTARMLGASWVVLTGVATRSP